MAKKVFGLDISDRSIEALVLSKPFWGKSKIEAYARTMLKNDIVANGLIKDQDKLAHKISELLASAQPRPIKTPFCIVSLPESQVFTTIFKLPAGLKRQEIIKTIPYQAEEVIPFRAEEIYFDFKTIAKDESVQEIFYVAVPTAIVDGYVEVLDRLGLKPLAFDLESISLARAVLDLKKSDSPVMMMDIGMRKTSLNIFQHQGLRQSLSLNVAGNHFTRSIAKALGLNPKEAEKIKHQLGFDSQTDLDKKALKALQAEFKKIISQAEKFLSFFEAETKLKVKELILTGGSSLFSGLDQYLADQLKIKTEIGNPWAGLSDPKNIFKADIGQAVIFSNVTGLALRGLMKDPVLGDINLLPIKPNFIARVREKTSERKSSSFNILPAIIVLVLLTSFGFLMYSQRADLLSWFSRQAGEPQISDTKTDLQKSKEDNGDKPAEEVQTATATPATASTTNNLATTTSATSTPGSATLPQAATTTRQIFAPAPEAKVKIRPSTLGYVNVRQGPGTSYVKVGQAEIGKVYAVISEKNGWYEIQLSDKVRGWVISTYVDAVN